MFKLVLLLSLVTLVAAFESADITLDNTERSYAHHAPKCYIAYKKCCSYKKAVYGKCHKKACHKVKKCKNVYHAAAPGANAAAGPALDASVKTYYGGHHKTNYGRQAEQKCWYENQCKTQEYDCVKRYDEGYHCEHEKKKYGSFHDW